MFLRHSTDIVPFLGQPQRRNAFHGLTDRLEEKRHRLKAASNNPSSTTLDVPTTAVLRISDISEMHPNLVKDRRSLLGLGLLNVQHLLTVCRIIS